MFTDVWGKVIAMFMHIKNTGIFLLRRIRKKIENKLRFFIVCGDIASSRTKLQI